MNLRLPALIALLVAAASFMTGCAGGHCSSGRTPVPCVSNFTKLCFHTEGAAARKYRVYRTAEAGPPLLILHELNGLSPHTLQVALELAGGRWTVYAPLLFGEYGDNRGLSAMCELKRNQHWDLKSPHDSGPILNDIEAMTRWVSQRHGGHRVVVMGSCLTGAFPLALLSLPEVKAGILCQPAIPLSTLGGLTPEQKRFMGLPPRKVDAALEAMRKDPSKRLLGFHYLEDPVAPFARFDTVHEQLATRGMADRFRPVVLLSPNSKRREDWWHLMPTTARRSLFKPHSTVTGSAIEEDRTALRELLLEQLKPLKATR